MSKIDGKVSVSARLKNVVVVGVMVLVAAFCGFMYSYVYSERDGLVGFGGMFWFVAALAAVSVAVVYALRAVRRK